MILMTRSHDKILLLLMRWSNKSDHQSDATNKFDMTARDPPKYGTHPHSTPTVFENHSKISHWVLLHAVK